MSEKITIRQGLDIALEGEAEKILSESSKSTVYALKPTDFHGTTPKLKVKEGDKLQAGSPVFIDKYRDSIIFVSPVSGTVSKIKRGAKRKILEIIIDADSSISYKNFDVNNIQNKTREEIKALLLEGGLWPFIKMRPIDIIANPQDTPKSIFISAFDTNPLAPDYDFILHNKNKEFAMGVELLSKLTDGKINLQTRNVSDDVFKQTKANVNIVSGPHPAGNIGVQAHKLDPINKGEIIWYINPQDVAILGNFALTGNFDASKVVALTGENTKNKRYFKTIIGSKVKSIVNDVKENSRIISGNPLTGIKVEEDGFLGYYDSQITVIPEGNSHKFFLTEGWLSAGFKKFSASRAYPTWILPKSKKYSIDTNLNGEKRSFVVTGEYEKVFPFDIYPVHLIKAIIINDIESMENLGIYEVAPEDFALCEFVCTSKNDIQQIVRDGLDLIYDECM